MAAPVGTSVQVGAGGAAQLAVETLALAPPRGDIWRRFRRNRLALIGLAVVVIMILAALLAPYITFYGKDVIPTGAAAHYRQGPTAAHWFGTDQEGRDLYTRTIFAARVSLRVGFLAALIATVIGVIAGAMAGYYRGLIDNLVMRVTDIFLAFPYILAAIVIIIVVGRGEFAVAVVLGLLGWQPIARVLRSSILQVKESEYVEAARAMGCRDQRIIIRHILPNAIQPVVVYATIFIGTAILSEAVLSYLGIGINEPTAAWGLMIAEGSGLLAISPHLLFFPALFLFLTVMAFVFIGDGLRDAIDPRLR